MGRNLLLYIRRTELLFFSPVYYLGDGRKGGKTGVGHHTPEDDIMLTDYGAAMQRRTVLSTKFSIILDLYSHTHTGYKEYRNCYQRYLLYQ